MSKVNLLQKLAITGIAGVIGIVGLQENAQAANIFIPGNLTTLGASHAHSDGAQATARAIISAPIPGTIFSGTATFASSPVGDAFGAGAGSASAGRGFIFLDAHARAVVIRTGPGGPLHAWGLGYADPTIIPDYDPFLDPFIDEELNQIIDDVSVIDVSPLNETQFQEEINNNPITSSSPGSDINLIGLAAIFDDDADEIRFDFSGNLLIETQNLAQFSTTLSFESEILDIRRFCAVDENGVNCMGGWIPEQLNLMRNESLITGTLDMLDFIVAVSPEFTFEDFESLDLRVQSIATAVSSVPEPSSTLGFFALGTLGAASTLKRKLKSSQSSEKETTKVS